MDLSHLPNKVLTSAPGKLILHGEHAVVHGTTALATSLNLRSYLELTANSSKVSLNFPDINLQGTWNISDLEETFCHLIHFGDNSMAFLDEEGVNHLKDFAGLSGDINTRNLAIIAFLYLYLCIFKSSASHSLRGMNALATSNLPTGAGLGSSAAFSASLVSGLLIFTGTLKVPHGRHDWTEEELELINRWAFEGEKVIHGNPSGVDNAVSVFGGALRYKSKAIEHLHEMPSLRVLLINTKVPRSTKILVAGVKDKLEKYPGVIKPVFDSIEDISQRCETVLSSLWGIEHDSFVEGATHNQFELYSTMEELIDMNQSFLKILGVSHPSIENVCTLTSEFGIHAKLTGAGGGGCVFAVLRPDYPKEKLEMVTTKLKEAGYEAWVTSIGGVGATYHESVDDVYEKGFILPKPLET